MDKNRKTPQIRFKGFTDDWEQRELGNDIADIVGGGTPSTTNLEYWNGNIDWYSPSEIGDKIYVFESKKKITISGLDNSSAKMLPPEKTILFTSRASIGEMAILMRPGTTNQGFQSFVIKNKFYPYYVYSMGSIIKKYALNNASGSTFLEISPKNLGKLKLYCPNFGEQEKIGQFFKNLDNLITLHQRKCEKLKKLKKSMLEKMFPKNGEKAPEVRFKGFTDDWEQCKLGELVSLVNRNDPNSHAPVMMITAENGFIKQEDRYGFNNAGKSLKKYTLLYKNEMAYNHGASKIRPYGSCFSLDEEEARIPFVYHCFKTKRHCPKFLELQLNEKNVESQLRQLISSGARMDGLLNISFKEYTTVNLMVPKLMEQKRIADFFKNLEASITLHQRKVEKLQKIKKSMLEKMFV